MSIRLKILIGFILVFVFGLILGVVGLISTSSLTSMLDEQSQLQHDNSSINSVVNAHNAWKSSLVESVLSGSKFNGSTDPETCAYGKWKNSEECKRITDPEILSLISQIEEPHSYIHVRARDIVALLESGNKDEATMILEKDIFPKLDKTVSLLTEASSAYDTLIASKSADIISFGNLMSLIIIVLIVFAMITCILLAWKIISSIMNPIRKMTNAAEMISTGDLDISLEYNVDDEIGRLVGSFNNIIENSKKQEHVLKTLSNGDLTVDVTPRSQKDAMNIALQKTINNLNKMFSEINNSTVQVANASNQIATSSQTLAQGSTEQASAVEQLSCSIAEIAHKTKENANLASNASKLGDTIKNNAQKGSAQMEHMVQAVKDIGDSSRSIGKIIKLIDDIAFQTNILALNAAVEAARAGQHGKGFAIVAEEVRSLASKSAEAAKDTGSLITDSIEKTELGVSIANETAESLSQIVSGINENSRIVGEIAVSSEEQTTAIDQINKGIEQVAQVVQQNSATSQESAAASEEMSGQAAVLKNLVSQFRIK